MRSNDWGGGAAGRVRKQRNMLLCPSNLSEKDTFICASNLLPDVSQLQTCLCISRALPNDAGPHAPPPRDTNLQPSEHHNNYNNNSRSTNIWNRSSRKGAVKIKWKELSMPLSMGYVLSVCACMCVQVSACVCIRVHIYDHSLTLTSLMK